MGAKTMEQYVLKMFFQTFFLHWSWWLSMPEYLSKSLKWIWPLDFIWSVLSLFINQGVNDKSGCNTPALDELGLLSSPTLSFIIFPAHISFVTIKLMPKSTFLKHDKSVLCSLSVLHETVKRGLGFEIGQCAELEWRLHSCNFGTKPNSRVHVTQYFFNVYFLSTS